MFSTNKKEEEKNDKQGYKGLNVTYPVYSLDNKLESIWDNDISYQCIDRISAEIAKLAPRHIVEKDGSEASQNDNIQRVLNRFNPQMTTFDALSKIIFNLYTRSNSWVYPMWEGKTLKALYPISPISAEFKEYAGEMYVTLGFLNGYKYQFRYSQLIHIRRQFYDDELMGTINERPLLNNMQINQALVEGLKKGMDASLQINGVVQYGTALSQKLVEGNVKQFEKQLKKSESGILGLDNQSTYREIKKDPKLIDEPTLKYVQTLITNHFNVSLPILNGNATKEEYDFWFSSCIMPILESLSQAFTYVIFTDRETSVGHKIRFYNYDRMKFMSSGELNQATATLLNAGAITINQLLVVYGLPPIGEEGNKRVQSLNYVDTNIANEYQMDTLKSKGGKEDAEE